MSMTHLKIGDNAPEIQAKDQDGNQVSLADFKDKKVILYFYPKDNTPGCTMESCNLRDNYSDLQKKGYEVLGVSADSEASHQKFAKRFKLPFKLLVDTDKKVLNDYGVWGEKKFMGRTYMGIHRITFVISEVGIIEDIILKVKTKSHTGQILENASRAMA
jgi:peroxiredoxin Q/BCP